MKSKLTQKEFSFLSQKFALQKESHRNLLTTISSKELLDEKICLEILKYLTLILNSPSLEITASLLSKRIAYLTTSACLYSMSIYNKGLDLSINNCYFDFNHKDGLWTSKMVIKDFSTFGIIDKRRDEFREKVVRNLFENHLSLIWDRLSTVSKISKKILWENTAVRVYSLYEKKIQKEVYEKRQKDIQDDFNFLVSSNIENIFNEDYNPLKTFYSKNRPRTRKTCCFFYKTKDKKVYCDNCPLLNFP